MAIKADAYLLHPGDYDAVDEDGRATSAGLSLLHELKEHANSLESRFGTLHGKMRTYEQWWTQNTAAVRWSSGKDDELARTLPAFPNAKGRILIAKATRANVKERVGYKIALSSDWSNQQQDATQKLERYCTGADWMADHERARRQLGQVQPTLTWFGAARGAAIAIPFVRSTNRSKDGDGYGDLEPYIIRTPDPLTCVWDESSYGLSFFASVDFRPQSDFYGMAGMENMQPSRKPGYADYCETFNVWWCDCDNNVWNATVVENCYLIPPTNHSKKRKLKRLPVVIDGPGFGSPKEAMIAGSDTASLADHYQGVLETNMAAYAVESYIKAIKMRLMQDAAHWSFATASERPISAEELKAAMAGNATIQLGQGGRIFPIQPPQLSESVAAFEAQLDALQQMGGMPNTAIAGVQAGMTGVAIQESLMQGDFAAGPISDMLKRMREEIARCFIYQHRAVGRKIKMQGIERTGGLFTAGVDAAELPPPDDYILTAIHSPFLIRDGYRDAQEAVTWRSAGRSFEAVADDMLADPSREVALQQDEELRKNPIVKLSDELERAHRRYGPNSLPVQVLTAALKQAVQQVMGPPAAATNAPRPGAAMDVEPMPQLPGGPAAAPPVGVNPDEMMDQQMLGQMGRVQGGNPNAY
jgi:hypothetical protein